MLVPIYNSAAFLPACLESIAAQSYGDLEIVLVDDASSDGSAEIAEAFAAGDERARYLRNDPNLGSRENFRTALGLATGEMVKFVCGDDLLRADAVETMVAVLEASADISMVSSIRKRIDENGADLADPPCLSVDTDVVVIDGYDAGNLLLQGLVNWIGEPTTALFRAGLLETSTLYELGSRRPARNLDVVWWLKLMAGRHMAYVGHPLSSFRSHSGQQSSDPALQPDLVLSWHDIIRGAVEIGYLADPGAEATALSAMVGMVNARIDSFPPEAMERVALLLGEINSRLLALAGAQTLDAFGTGLVGAAAPGAGGGGPQP